MKFLSWLLPLISAFFGLYIFKAFFPVGIFLLVYVSKLLSKLLEGISFITISLGAAPSSTTLLYIDGFLLWTSFFIDLSSVSLWFIWLFIFELFILLRLIIFDFEELITVESSSSLLYSFNSALKSSSNCFLCFNSFLLYSISLLFFLLWSTGILSL